MLISDDDIVALRQRNESRMQTTKEAMGEKWILHKANSPKKLKQKRK